MRTRASAASVSPNVEIRKAEIVFQRPMDAPMLARVARVPNPIRFARDYQNRLFKGELPFHGAQVHSDETMVGFGGNIFADAECLIPRISDLEKQAKDWDKGDMIMVSGRIEAMDMFGESVRLSSCRFE
jgi:hypothetical protein